ncbi:uncharacterized protein LOC111697626 [Eurytemora carolleeae]|uniref:uncharacterized protein LOC111697626 n=1 Tax=Eurytemora carolleeae TaxID=1294199 RepID=UPI000C786F75|nr:uncharacterized protein LOC111697626 [Eurytemora carolleeae]|eukprot:XP_023323463.1 uncharacterized protein LOC111697626 [Eurytemora affinis]
MEIYCLIFSLISVTMGFHIGDTVEVEVKHEAKTMATSIGLDQYPVKLVWGHGLGSKDPSTKNRFSDRTSNITFSAMDDAKARCICYDARGHGESHGWEETANNMFQVNF